MTRCLLALVLLGTAWFAWFAWGTSLTRSTVFCRGSWLRALRAIIGRTLVTSTRATRALWARAHWQDACANTGLTTGAAEQTRLGLLENFYFGVGTSDTQVSEGTFRGLINVFTGCFYPIHGYRSFLLRFAFARFCAAFDFKVEGLALGATSPPSRPGTSRSTSLAPAVCL